MADYTNKRGIFSLLDVRERQNAGNWSTRGDAWLSPSTFLVKNLVGFGYIGAGTNPPHYSSVERIDYSNDTATASVRGPLSAATYLLTATGNTSFGYYAGGYNHGSRVDRIDYSNDNATASPKGPLVLILDIVRHQQVIRLWLFWWWKNSFCSIISRSC